ncbi:MAG TPA: hypothetical protein VGE08_10830 [Steroidobacter sp.]|uniref:hypothetical protein n=1 Tax=Steroidobacter sp. TaxID=1978227 RepID=UPI002EDB84CC
MRSVLTLAAAVAINLAALALLQWDVTRASSPPAGEVIIAQLDEPTALAPLAQARAEDQDGRSVSRSL